MKATISTKKYHALECLQNAGHYCGQYKPRIVHYQATHWAVVSDTGRPVLRPAEHTDYAQNTLAALAARTHKVQSAIAATRQQ